MPTLIKPLKRTHKKVQSQHELEYFSKRSSATPLMDYTMLEESIQNAQEFICIVSTSAIHTSLLDMLHKTNQKKGVRLYILLQDFEKAEKTLDFFGEVNPACIRQAKDLNNNFLIVDGEISCLMINSLQRDQNICIQFEGDYSQDLYHIFNDYFWNRADEQCLLNVRTKELVSPFPPFELSLKYIAFREGVDSYDACITPCDEKNYKQFKNNASSLYIASHIELPVSLKGDKSYLGQFVVDKNLFEDISPDWELKKSTLARVHSVGQEVIPFNGVWTQPKHIDTQVKRELSDIEAINVESMPNTNPETYPEVPYACEVEYHWCVMPPKKPEDAKKACLYEDFEALKDKLDDDCRKLERRLKQTERAHQSSPVASFFSGASHKLKVLDKERSKVSKQDIKTLSIHELEDFFEHRFKKLFEDVDIFCCNHEKSLEEKVQKEKWNREKEEKERELEKKESELKDIQIKVNENKRLMEQVKLLNAKIKDKNLDSDKVKKLEEEKNNIDIQTVSPKSLEKERRLLERDVKSIKQDIEKKYSRFEYKPSVNELEQLKHKDINLKWESFKLPAFGLPDVGVLFENNQGFFLEIQYDEELARANQICKRYKKNNREAKVVVKVH